MAKKAVISDPNARLGANQDLPLKATDPEERKRSVAIVVANPSLQAARAMLATEGTNGLFRDLDVVALTDVLKEQAAKANTGNLALAEGMLINQAVALQALFSKLVERGMNADLLDPYEVHLRLALRAQAQCTRTLEVLAAIKNPPVVIAKQANIANQQQVNNNVAPRAREVENAPSKLLETLPDERLEFGTPATASGFDSHLEPVGAVNRAEVGSR